MDSRYDIEFAAQDFNPNRIMEIRHHLVDHPLLSLPKLKELALRLPPDQVRFHASTATISSNFNTAENDHPPRVGLEQALAQMEVAGSWIALHNVQTDPEYAALIKKVLDGVNERIAPRDPGMFYPAFWIFIQSPGAVTPYHMDHEQNFLMQIRGEKVAKVWPAEKSLTPATIADFHAKNVRTGAVYSADLEAHAQVVHLKPGVGVYMPFTCPHAVTNGDQVSITISMTYCTKSTRRVEIIHRCNAFLKKHGMEPSPIGSSRLRDHLKYLVFDQVARAKNLARGLPARLPSWSALGAKNGSGT